MSQTHKYNDIRQFIFDAAKELGFEGIAISQPSLSAAKINYLDWLAQGCHGEMSYMERHTDTRFLVDGIVPEAVRVISVTLPYLAEQLDEDWQTQCWSTLKSVNQANITRYALGRDYHKVVRSKLQKLAIMIAECVAPTPLFYRAFSDSAPIPEVEIAQQTSLGWRGKHSLLLNRESGSMFFLGELYVNLALPSDANSESHCGSCTACMDVCPTQAIVAPYRVDARRCISYLTIEYSGVIPHEFRESIGNRIYGCDDCQLVCPWNKFAQKSKLPDFAVRHDLHQVTLLDLLKWDEETFKIKTAGSAIYRIGHAQWQRNIILALGNANFDAEALEVLKSFVAHSNNVLAEQARWSVEKMTLRNLLLSL